MEFIRKQYAVTPPGGGGGGYGDGSYGAAADDAGRLASELENAVSESTQLRLDLTSISTLLGTTILKATQDFNKEVRDVAKTIGQNLAREVRGIQKDADKLASLSRGLGKDLFKTAAIEEQIAATKSRQVRIAEMFEELAITQGGLTEDQLRYQRYITQELNDQVKVLGKYVKLSEDANERLKTLSGIFKGLAKVPFVGQLIDANAVLEKVKQTAMKTGSTWKAMAAGVDETFKSIGKSLLNPISIATSLFGIFKALFMMAINYNKKIFETAKILGTSASQAERLRNAFQAMAPIGLMAKETAESYAQISDQLGFMGPVTGDFAVNMALIQKRTGASAAHMGVVAQQAALTGKSVTGTYATMMGAAKLEGARNKLALTARQIMEGMSKVSATVVLNLKGSTTALAAGVVQATKLGTTLDQINKQGESFLDFETSIANQFEAEVLSGQTFNLERARSLFLQGKTIEGMKELNKQMITQDKFAEMDMITKESVAKMTGLTTEELSKQFILQKQAEKLGAKEGQSLANRYAYLVKIGRTHESIAADIGAQEAADLRRQSMADQWEATLEKIKDLLGKILQDPVTKIVNKVIAFVNNTKLVAAFGEKIKFIFEKVANVLSSLPTILQRAVKVSQILASLAIGRAVAATVASVAGSSKLALGAGAVLGAAAGVAMYAWLNSLISGLTSGGGGGSPSISASGAAPSMEGSNTEARSATVARNREAAERDRELKAFAREIMTLNDRNRKEKPGVYMDNVKVGTVVTTGIQQTYTAQVDNSTNLSTGG